MTKLKKIALLGVLLTAVSTLSGCDLAQWMAYVFGLEKTELVKAECADLDHSKVAVLIISEPSMHYQNRYLRESLGTAMRYHLEENVPGIDVVDPVKVSSFQNQNLNWDRLSKSQIAKKLGVDYLLVIGLVNYTKDYPGSSDGFQVNISAQAMVYSATNSGMFDNMIWQSESTVDLMAPKNPAYSLTESGKRRLIIKAEKEFAKKLCRKFYDRTVEVKPKGMEDWDMKNEY